jgi:hypothetical protein
MANDVFQVVFKVHLQSDGTAYIAIYPVDDDEAISYTTLCASYGAAVEIAERICREGDWEWTGDISFVRELVEPVR